MRRRSHVIAAVAVLAALVAVEVPNSLASASSAPADAPSTADSDQVLVTVSGGSPDDARLTRAAGTSMRTLQRLQGDTWVVKLDGKRTVGQVRRLEAQLRASGDAVSVRPDALMFPTAVPTDPNWPQQWDLDTVSATNYGANVPGAWDLTTGSASTVVAVIDTGYRPHADLFANLLTGYDFVADTNIANDGNGRDADASDPGDWITSTESSSIFSPFWRCPVGNSSWHGTHVAGTIAALQNNGIGVSGIAPGVKVLPVRVLGKCGGYTSDIIAGMRWAAGLTVSGAPANPTPAKVLNLSLGGSGTCTSDYQTAINDIAAAGASVVVAAGNSNADANQFTPASCSGVITVAATGRLGNRAYYSNYGASVEIAAPGGDKQEGNTILSTLNAGTTAPGADSYANYQGTSMATPHVVGVLALMLSANPTLTVAQRVSILQSTATPFPVASTCSVSMCGPGIVNAAAAVQASVGAEPPPPPPPPPAVPGVFSKLRPNNGATGVSRTPVLTWGASSDATSYEYCLAQGTSCSNYISVGSATSVQVTSSLRAGRRYAWQVRARNSAGVTVATGGTWTFTTSK